MFNSQVNPTIFLQVAKPHRSLIQGKFSKFKNTYSTQNISTTSQGSKKNIRLQNKPNNVSNRT